MTRTFADMTHADTLRALASGTHPGLSYSAVVALIAGVEALDTVDRVRELLTRLRRSQQFTRRRWDDTGDTWDGAASDTLHYIIYDLTNALEGDTE